MDLHRVRVLIEGTDADFQIGDHVLIGVTYQDVRLPYGSSRRSVAGLYQRRMPGRLRQLEGNLHHRPPQGRYADRRQRHGVVPYLPLGGPCRRDADLRQRIAFDADQVMWTTSTPEVVLFIGTIVIAVALLL